MTGAILVSALGAIATPGESAEQMAQRLGIEGATLVEGGRLREGIERLREAAQLHRRLGRLSDEAECLTAVGIAQHRLAETDASLETLGRALEIYREVNDRRGQAQVRLLAVTFLLELDRPRELVEYLEPALPFYRRAEDRPKVFKCLAWLGKAQFRLGRYREAAAAFEEALEILRSFGAHPDRDPIWESLEQDDLALRYDLAGTYDSLGRYEEALALFEQVVEEEKDAPDSSQKAGTLSAMGSTLRALGRPDDAEDYFERAEAIYRSAPAMAGRYVNLQNLAVLYLYQGRYPEARSLLVEAVDGLRRTKDPLLLATALDTQGVLAMRMGLLEEAARSLTEALELHRRMGNAGGEAVVLNNLSVLAFREGRLEQSLGYLEQSLMLRQASGDRLGEAATLANIAHHQVDLGRFEDVWDRYQEALDIVRAIGGGSMEAAILASGSQVLALAGDRAEALAWAEGTVEVARRAGDRVAEMQGLKLVGTIHLAAADVAAATVATAAAEKLSEELGDRLQGSEIGLLSAGLAFRSGKPQEALERLDRHLEEGLEIGVESHRATALMLRGDALRALGRDGKALAAYREAAAAEELVLDRVRLDTLLLDLAGRSAGLRGRLIDQLLRMGRADEAFAAAEQARARALLHQLGNRELYLRAEGRRREAAEELRLRRKLAALERQLNDAAKEPPARWDPVRLRQLSEQLERARGDYQALRARLRRSDPELASVVAAKTVGLEETRALLDEDTTLVAYFLLGDHLGAWVVEREGFHARQLPVAAADLEQRVGLLRDGIGARDFDFDLAAALYGLLIEPLLPLVHHGELRIVPHGVLHALPFGALWDAERGRFLVESHTLSYLPSASVLPYLAGKRNPDHGRILVLGDPDGSLPDASVESRRVAELFGAEPLLGPEATESALRQRAASADVLHLAAHARLAPERPLFSRIELAAEPPDDGRLEVHEVYGLDLREANLVVLSACSTALGRRTAADDVVGLQRAFLFAGTPAVVSTLWPIEDEASAALVTRFYRHARRSGGDYAAALRAAQLETLEQPRWRSPYYWAAFVLTGDGPPL